MGRLSLVFVLLVLSTGAARAAEVCSCEEGRAILPAPGSTEVPRNTKIWVFGGSIGTGALDDGGTQPRSIDGAADRERQWFDVGALAPGHAYTFGGSWGDLATQFTTGAVDDTTPPAAPVVRTLGIAVSEYGESAWPVTQLVFDAALDRDVAMLRFSFTSHGQRTTRTTTTQSWRVVGRPVCGTELPFAVGDHVTVEVIAIDLAGNESAPAVRELEVWRGPPTQPACAHLRHFRCGLGDMGFLFLGMAFVAFVVIPVLIVWLVRYFQRMRARQNAVAEPISLLVAERLARAVQRRGGVLAAVGIAGVPALVGMDLGTLAIVSTIAGCVGLRGFFVARAALRLMEPSGAAGHDVIAEALGPTVVVRGPTEEVRLDVTPKALAAARRHAVPTSVAKRP
jgi:hypothetical protein